MRLNIIHLPQRVDRFELLMEELRTQGITDYRMWDGILDPACISAGISRAHKQIVSDAQVNGLPEVTIAEDDLRFTDTGAFEYYASRRPTDFDLYLGGIYYGQMSRDGTVGDFAGLTMYTIHHRFYATFLSLPENAHLDRALVRRGRYVVVDPFVVVQRNGYSDNARKVVNYDHFLRNRRLFRSASA